jgi:uncharacterized membrane protein YqjE
VGIFMAAADRSLSHVLQDIVRNVQDIIRSEVRLAKTELREEAAKAKNSTLLLGAGAVGAIFALFFLLLTIVYALALVMPSWGAALVVGAALTVVAIVLLRVGLKQFQRIHPTPEHTVESIKENVQWAKQQTK